MARKDRSAIATQPGAQDLSLSLYLQRIANCKPLSTREEAELTAKIRQGDQNSLNKLVLANLRFVVSVARNYQHQGLPLSDLINEGNLGLINAARRFDEKKNFRFISYAVWWIRQAILQLLANHSRIIRLPLNRVGYIHKIGVAQRKLEQDLHRLPTTEEIAGELDITDQDVQCMIQVGGRQASLDASIENGQGNLYDMISSENEVDIDEVLYESSLNKELSRALSKLDKRENEVIRLYFGIGYETAHTLEEIGAIFSLTRERVRQIREKALSKLQRSSLDSNLRSFLSRG